MRNGFCIGYDCPVPQRFGGCFATPNSMPASIVSAPDAILLLTYCGMVMMASLVGGVLPSRVRLTHLRTQMINSCVGGLMLGIAMLHLLPQSGEVLGSFASAGTGSLIGLTVMFLIIRLFHTHDHGVGDHDHSHCDHADHSHRDARGVSWMALFFGMVLHTVIDGVALASSVIADAGHAAWWGLGGLGTFLVVCLHKPLDSFAVMSVMHQQRWSRRAQTAANVAFAMACPIGGLAFYFGFGGAAESSWIVGWGLAVSSGFFIGIALADLLPEVAFHDHDRGKLTTAFLIGISIAVVLENLPGHSHNHGGPDHHHGRLEPKRGGPDDRHGALPMAHGSTTKRIG